jgi:hypothetical protein
MHACRTGRRRRCTPEIGFRSRPVDARRVAADSTATSVTRLELLVVTRNNSNAGTELAANASLHPISCYAQKVGPRERTDRSALVCRVHGTRPGAGAAGPAGLHGRAMRPWAPVVTTRPRGGAISAGAKNAAEAPHTATASPRAGKVNVGHRSAAGDAGSPPRVSQRGGVQMRFFRAGSGRARAHHR